MRLVRPPASWSQPGWGEPSPDPATTCLLVRSTPLKAHQLWDVGDQGRGAGWWVHDT